MPKLKLFYTLFATTLILFNCKKDVNPITYEFTDKPYDFVCKESDIENDLLKEALYSFEDDIVKYYDPKQLNLNRAYGQFLLGINHNEYIHMRIISPRSRAILERLKQEDHLFINGQLNTKSPLISCVVHGVKDEDLKTTFNALLSAGSLKSSILASGIMFESKKVLADKAMATYVALDMYYAKIAERDKLKNTTPQ